MTYLGVGRVVLNEYLFQFQALDAVFAVESIINVVELLQW
jgi:hypothetical protein